MILVSPLSGTCLTPFAYLIPLSLVVAMERRAEGLELPFFARLVENRVISVPLYLVGL
jgi:hypothetical protein